MIHQDNHLGAMHNLARRCNLKNQFLKPLCDNLQNLIMKGLVSVPTQGLSPWHAQSHRDSNHKTHSTISAKRPASTWSPAIRFTKSNQFASDGPTKEPDIPTSSSKKSLKEWKEGKEKEKSTKGHSSSVKPFEVAKEVSLSKSTSKKKASTSKSKIRAMKDKASLEDFNGNLSEETFSSHFDLMSTVKATKRTRRPSFRVTDPDNDGDVEMSSHREARASAQTNISSQAVSAHSSASVAGTRPSSQTSTRAGSVTCEDVEDNDDDAQLSSASNAGAPTRKKRRTGKKARATSTSTPNNTTEPPTGESGASADGPPASAPVSDSELPGLVSDSSDDDEPEPARKVSPTLDIAAFFEKPGKRGPNGRSKLFRKCRVCVSEKYIVNEVTTLRRHLQASHRKHYNKWCERHEFQSKLPKDVKARKDAEQEATAAQTTLDGHLRPIDPPAPILKYSDALFKEAAEDWMISTNQPLDALSHPHFHHMIDVASRATNGVKIPERRATRDSILQRFKKNVAELKEKFNSSEVPGDVSLTCDAWQAGNRDAYFAVTGHWIEQRAGHDWHLRSALLGFTQMNTSHNGARLGRALYDIAKQYRITHKFFQDKINTNKRRLNSKAGEWAYKNRHIRCLAHIINLATQAVIATYSSTAHINIDSSTADVEKTQSDLADIATRFIRDEVGLIRLLAVKARSSAKRMELLKQLQSKEGVQVPLTLILDMKVRWSSTFAMLQRAYDLREFINDFVYKISQEEPTAEKQRELLELRVSEDEWTRVKEFLKVLKHADAAQHTFSTETDPSLCHALPALERLHKTWTALTSKDRYSSFHDALNAGLSKVSTYYNKTSAVDAYTMTMILSPALKTSYFQKQWGEELELSARTQCEKIFEERWKRLNPPKSANMPTRPLAPSTSKTLLDIDLSDDEDSASPSPLSTSMPSSTSVADKPWLKEFDKYLDGEDELEVGQSVVAWWGVHARRLPTWASLAQDYLAIMASSVSSERAFSAAGITISKRRNSLKSDIVEALQVLKSLINSDLIFREPDVTTDWEFENEVEEDDGDSSWVDIDVSDNEDIVS
ncbi:hypothetical protein MD484_g8767, partial [Candolleomyces efflorescens]